MPAMRSFLAALALLTALGCSDSTAPTTPDGPAGSGELLKAIAQTDLPRLIEQNQGKVVVVNFWSIY